MTDGAPSARMVPGEHHVRNNMYTAHSQGGTFKVAKNLGHIPNECEVATRSPMVGGSHVYYGGTDPMIRWRSAAGAPLTRRISSKARLRRRLPLALLSNDRSRIPAEQVHRNVWRGVRAVSWSSTIKYRGARYSVPHEWVDQPPSGGDFSGKWRVIPMSASTVGAVMNTRRPLRIAAISPA
jgi:hypothetical protein